MFAGTSHLTFQRDEFQAQVPDWFPIKADVVVVASGFVEIALGLALLLLGRRRVPVGWVVAGFFVVIFPGNIAQWIEGNDAFGLDTGAKRFTRLFFQPLLVVWALWSTGAWRAWRRVPRRPHRAVDRAARYLRTCHPGQGVATTIDRRGSISYV